MKRFASLITAAALAGSLISVAPVAQADSTMYLVPISDINASYTPGAIVKFAAVIDLGNSSFAAFSVPTAVAYFPTEFGAAKPTAIYDASGDPTNPGNPLWNLTTPVYYSTSASAINGAKVLTIQPTVGHDTVSGANGPLPVAVGTYTIATFAFPIAPTTTGKAIVWLPTPFGYSSSAFTTDGGYTPGVGPSLSIKGKDIKGALLSDPLTFPDTGGKRRSLTFNVTHSEMYLVPISDTSVTYAPGATVKFAAVVSLGQRRF